MESSTPMATSDHRWRYNTSNHGIGDRARKAITKVADSSTSKKKYVLLEKISSCRFGWSSKNRSPPKEMTSRTIALICSFTVLNHSIFDSALFPSLLFDIVSFCPLHDTWGYNTPPFPLIFRVHKPAPPKKKPLRAALLIVFCIGLCSVWAMYKWEFLETMRAM